MVREAPDIELWRDHLHSLVRGWYVRANSALWQMVSQLRDRTLSAWLSEAFSVISAKHGGRPSGRLVYLAVSGCVRTRNRFTRGDDGCHGISLSRIFVRKESRPRYGPLLSMAKLGTFGAFHY